MKFEKEVIASPAFDKTNPDPSKNYGVGALTMRFLLKGEKGAVQFYFNTGWYLPHVEARLKEINGIIERSGWDVGYHSYKPIYDGQSSMGKCSVLDGCECFYDGSSLLADEWMGKFVGGGTEWLWKEMENYYNEIFGE